MKARSLVFGSIVVAGSCLANACGVYDLENPGVGHAGRATASGGSSDGSGGSNNETGGAGAGDGGTGESGGSAGASGHTGGNVGGADSGGSSSAGSGNGGARTGGSSGASNAGGGVDGQGGSGVAGRASGGTSNGGAGKGAAAGSGGTTSGGSISGGAGAGGSSSGVSGKAGSGAAAGNGGASAGTAGSGGCTSGQLVLNPSKDASLDASKPAVNNSADTQLEIKRWGAAYSERAILAFNIGLSSSATIQSATLAVFLSLPSGYDNTLGLHRVAAGRSWEETQVTWQTASTSSGTWSNAGGDFDSAASATVSVSSSLAAGTKFQFNVKNDVQAFVNGSANYGWILRDSGDGAGAGQAVYIGSREHATYKPTLTIQYCQ